MIIISGILLGRSFCNDYKREIVHLRMVEGMIKFLEREIQYARTTLPEACLKTADKVEKPYSDILRNIYEGMNRQAGKSFEEVWQKEFERGLIEGVLKKEETEKLVACGKMNSVADSGMQTEFLKRSAEEFAMVRNRKEEETAKRSKAVFSLCTAGGIMLTIMLL